MFCFSFFAWIFFGVIWLPGFNFALNLLVYGFYLRCLFLFWFCFDLLSIAMFICLDARESCIMLRIVLSRFVSRELCVVIFSVFGCHVWSGSSVLRLELVLEIRFIIIIFRMNEIENKKEENVEFPKLGEGWKIRRESEWELIMFVLWTNRVYACLGGRGCYDTAPYFHDCVFVVKFRSWLKSVLWILNLFFTLNLFSEEIGWCFEQLLLLSFIGCFHFDLRL